MASPDHILTVDLGTSECTASLWTPDGLPAARASADVSTLRPAPDEAEQDPQAWWDTAAALAGVFGRERFHEVTGLVPDTECGGGSIRWLR